MPPPAAGPAVRTTPAPASSEVGKGEQLTEQRAAEIAEAVRFNTSLQVSRTLATLAREPEEEAMPRGGAHKPCPECRSTTRHKSGCSKPPRGATPAPKPVVATKPAAKAGAVPAPTARELAATTRSELESMGLDELLDLERAVGAEKARRIDEARKAIEQLTGAQTERAA